MQAARLLEKGYSQSEVARKLVAEGAEWLHIIDLDGSRTGKPANLDHLRAIAREDAPPVLMISGHGDIATIARASHKAKEFLHWASELERDHRKETTAGVHPGAR